MDFDSLKRDIILSRLDGWKLETKENTQEDYLQLEENHIISETEIEKFWNITIQEVKNYLITNEIPNDDRIIYPICTWCAGLLYKKYTSNSTENMEDTTYIGTGRGNDLVNESKKQLDSWKQSKIVIW